MATNKTSMQTGMTLPDCLLTGTYNQPIYKHAYSNNPGSTSDSIKSRVNKVINIWYGVAIYNFYHSDTINYAWWLAPYIIYGNMNYH